MPDGVAEIVEIEIETSVAIATTEYRAIEVDAAGDEVHLEVTEQPANTVSTSVTQYRIEAISADVYFGDLTNDLITGAVKVNEFTVLFNGENTFNISSEARRLVSVMINQIDYADDCEISPVGSGRVLYTVPENGYTLEIGDRVRIVWTL